MLFSDVLDDDCVIEFDESTPEETLQRLVEPLAATGAIRSYEVRFLVGKLLAREASFKKDEVGRRFSTGFGNGGAVPHARSETLGMASLVPCDSLKDRIQLVVGRNRTPLDWNALDRIPVWLFFCLIERPEAVGRQHGFALQLVGRYSLWAPVEALRSAHNFKTEFLRTAKEYDERERSRATPRHSP